MSIGRPRSSSGPCAIALALLVVLGTLLAPPAFARPSAPTSRAADPGYTIVPWANQSVRILDSRVAWLPPLIGFTGAGLLLANDTYAAAPSAVAAISSPAPNGGVALYDYGARATRNLTFPWSISGAVGPSRIATPFTRDGRTYVLTLDQEGNGITGGLTYLGTDLQVVAAGILDYPGFAHYVAVNLSIPLTSLGFAYNTTVGLSFDVTPDGANLSAIVAVGAYTGGGHFWSIGPPQATYVYFVDLAQASWADGGPLVLTPERTLTAMWPVVPSYSIRLTPSQLLIQAGAGPDGKNLQFVDLDRRTWTNATVPGRWPVWHGRIGGTLYLLEDDWVNGSYDAYALDAVVLDASGAAVGATEVWEKIFPRTTPDVHAVPVVSGDRLDVFLGKNGYVGGPAPDLITIDSYDLVCGTLLSETSVDLTMPLLNGLLLSLAYPSLGDVALMNGFVAEQTHGVLYPLDLPSVVRAAAAARNAPVCSSCVYATYVTRDAFPHVDLLIEEQYAADVFGSSSTTNLTAVELTANAPAPPPLPAPAGGCVPTVPPLGGGPTPLALVVAVLGLGLVAPTVAVTLAVAILLRRMRRRETRTPPTPPRPGT